MPQTEAATDPTPAEGGTALIDDLVIALRTLLDHIILADAPDDDPAIAAARAALAKAGRLT